MTIYHCARCGQRGTRGDMVVSRATGNAYCRDERACDKRREAALTRTTAAAR